MKLSFAIGALKHGRFTALVLHVSAHVSSVLVDLAAILAWIPNLLLNFSQVPRAILAWKKDSAVLGTSCYSFVCFFQYTVSLFSTLTFKGPCTALDYKLNSTLCQRSAPLLTIEVKEQKRQKSSELFKFYFLWYKVTTQD